MPTTPIYHDPHSSAAAKPTRTIFEPYNSSATGHQRADNRLSGSTAWRDSRTHKLGEQFRAGAAGGARVADLVGAGSEGFGVNGRLENGAWERGASGLRGRGQRGLRDMGWLVGKPGVSGLARGGKEEVVEGPEKDAERDSCGVEGEAGLDFRLQSHARPQLFANLTIYINGSTAPLVSDHKLKRLLAEHGARVAIALGRRTVTHVVLGRPNGHADGNGAGGGLSASKLQKEIANVRGKGVKFVSVEWVVESVKAGKRLPEARFACLKLAPKGQKSVLGMLENKEELTMPEVVGARGVECTRLSKQKNGYG